MKQLIFGSFLVLFFGISNLSAQSSGAQEEESENLAEKSANCICESITLALQFKAELDAAESDEERGEISEQAALALEKITCISEIDVEIKQLSEEEKNIFSDEVEKLVKAKCEDAYKTFSNVTED